MYELHVEETFSAAHSLRGYRGKCEALHGHNWRVRLTVRGARLGKLGMLMDFGDLKSALGRVLERLDHKHLNADCAEFGPSGANPTTENVARVIADAVAGELPDGVSVSGVRVWESDTASAEWFPEKA